MHLTEKSATCNVQPEVSVYDQMFNKVYVETKLREEQIVKRAVQAAGFGYLVKNDTLFKGRFPFVLMQTEGRERKYYVQNGTPEGLLICTIHEVIMHDLGTNNNTVDFRIEIKHTFHS